MEEQSVRGRPRARSASPSASRRQSRAARTPPSTPDPRSSPTAVCPSSPTSKGSCASFLMVASGCAGLSQIQLSPGAGDDLSAGARRVLEVLAPSSLIAMPSPPRPPGFDCSPVLPTPPLVCSGPVQRTPPPPRVERAAARAPLAPLFVVGEQPLLSPPPDRRTSRRKALAGMKISGSGAAGFLLRRASARLKERRKAAPVARAAETAICRGLGIVQDGEEVTEQAMALFASRFEGQGPEHVLEAMRAIFKIGSPDDEALAEALLGHGGEAGLDLQEDGGTTTADA